MVPTKAYGVHDWSIGFININALCTVNQKSSHVKWE